MLVSTRSGYERLRAPSGHARPLSAMMVPALTRTTGSSTLGGPDAACYSGVTYAAVRPPSTRNVEPFTYDDSSLARKSAALAISRGVARRPIGRWIRRRSYAAGL